MTKIEKKKKKQAGKGILRHRGLHRDQGLKAFEVRWLYACQHLASYPAPYFLRKAGKRGSKRNPNSERFPPKPGNRERWRTGALTF